MAWISSTIGSFIMSTFLRCLQELFWRHNGRCFPTQIKIDGLQAPNHNPIGQVSTIPRLADSRYHTRQRTQDGARPIPQLGEDRVSAGTIWQALPRHRSQTGRAGPRYTLVAELRIRVTCLNFQGDCFGNAESEPASRTFPPVVSDLLVSGYNQITARPSGKVAWDNRFDVERGFLGIPPLNQKDRQGRPPHSPCFLQTL